MYSPSPCVCQIFVFNIRSLSLCVYSLWMWNMGGKCLKWFKYKIGGGGLRWDVAGPLPPSPTSQPQYTLSPAWGPGFVFKFTQLLMYHSLYGHNRFPLFKVLQKQTLDRKVQAHLLKILVVLLETKSFCV